MRFRTFRGAGLAAFAALSLAASSSSAGAQTAQPKPTARTFDADTATIRAMTQRQKDDGAAITKITRSQSVKQLAVRMAARADSILALAVRVASAAGRVDTVTVTVTLIRRDTVFVAVRDSAPPASGGGSGGVSGSTTGGSTTGGAGSSPATIAGATVAALPLATPVTPYPTGGRVVPVAAGMDLQAALNAARAGDVLSLSPCATWIGQFTLPKRADSGWVVVRTNVSDAAIGAEGSRMTPTRAAAACLAKVLTNAGGAAAAIATAPGARGWRLDGLEIGAAPSAQNLNAFVAFGTDAPGGQTSIARQPYDLVIARSYIHGNATLNVRRCVILNSGATEVVDSWLSECHDATGDSQGTLTYNGTGPHRIENNHIEGGHQCFMSGGSDPGITGLVPSDITFRRNHCFRPVAWFGVWQTKTILEAKNLRRALFEGNIFENVKEDAQAGFAVLLKSTNQDGGCVWCITSDVTFRYNIVRNIGNGVNLAANPQGGLPATRFYFSDNVFQNLNVPPFRGAGIPLQLLGGLSDLIFDHNTWGNSTLNAISLDEGTKARAVFRSNVIPVGQYGVKGADCSAGAGCLARYLPGVVFAGNAIVGASCADYPAGNTCPALAPLTATLGVDGRPVGADTARVNAATRGVDVAP